MFGVFLVFTGFKIIRHRDDEGDKERAPRRSACSGGSCRCPTTLDGHKFFTTIEAKRAATPLLAALS